MMMLLPCTWCHCTRSKQILIAQTLPTLKVWLFGLALGTEFLDGVLNNNHAGNCLLSCAPSSLLDQLPLSSPLLGNVVEASLLLSSTPQRYSEYSRYVLLHFKCVMLLFWIIQGLTVYNRRDWGKHTDFFSVQLQYSNR